MREVMGPPIADAGHRAGIMPESNKWHLHLENKRVSRNWTIASKITFQSAVHPAPGEIPPPSFFMGAATLPGVHQLTGSKTPFF
ncbi:hypothetical protein [Sorangium sp. So ce385]|uniref:hypothetical protein n=1 Tax=Sorangium sp. So ce385 TaxID=3133308 RepID=UPI003F5B0CE0